MVVSTRPVSCTYRYSYCSGERSATAQIQETGSEIIYKADEDTPRLRYGSDYTPKYRG